MRKTSLIDQIDLQLPDLSPSLDGLTILHITDLHVRGPRKRFDRLVNQINQLTPAPAPGSATGSATGSPQPSSKSIMKSGDDINFRGGEALKTPDLLVFTGDLMAEPGHETPTYNLIKQIVEVTCPKIGSFGVFGNHDTSTLRDQLAELPVNWLNNKTWTCNGNPNLPISILGIDCSKKGSRGDLVAALNNNGRKTADNNFRLLLTHLPTWIPAAGDVGINLVLAGHTHGGQCRLPNGQPIINNTHQWPLRLTTGLLRSGNTTALISRGLGEGGFIQGMRFFCPPHAPLITLRPAANSTQRTKMTTCVKHW